jgi:hypothetical protein
MLSYFLKIIFKKTIALLRYRTIFLNNFTKKQQIDWAFLYLQLV